MSVELYYLARSFTFDLRCIIRDVKQLRKALEPQAELHRRRDVRELKNRVIELEALFQGLPAGVPHDLQGDLHIAVKGIVREKKVKKKPKPDLCDDQNIYDVYDV